MKKRIVSVLMIIVLLAGILSVNALAAGGLSNFTKVHTYTGQFNDVPSAQWYADEVQLAYEYGLINGKTSTTFEPGSYLTIAEALKIAAIIHSIYNTGEATFENGTPWYTEYVNYCLYNGIIQEEYGNYNAYATRSDFAMIFANALPEEALSAINNISAGSIPDVSYSSWYGPAVYLLYGAGILTGSGNEHAYYPNDNIKRSEVAAIVARMVKESYRVRFSMATELTATQIAAQCSPAVFYIVVYDGNGQAYAQGSGFFIGSSGLAVTNYHVIEGASRARIMTTDGEVYEVSGVYDYNKDYDLALLQVTGDGFPFLTLGDSDNVAQGQTVYAIGNPQGLTNTFSQGIVSNADRQYIDSPVHFIQFDAATSHGSSGGALLNTYGEVIGVTSAGYETGQNLNLAVPINLLSELSDDTLFTFTAAGGNQFAGEIELSSTDVTVKAYGTATVTISDVLASCDTVTYMISNASVAGCRWEGNWYNNNTQVDLGIKGFTPGTTTISVYLLDAYDNVLASDVINVTVTEGTAPAVSFYPSYYPVVDLGAYEGVKLLDHYVSNNRIYYLYAANDFYGNIDDVFDRYVQLLMDRGFYYSDTETVNGVDFDKYAGDNWWVAFALVYSDNGTPYVKVIVF